MTPEGTAHLAGHETGRGSPNAIEKVATELGTSVELVRSFGAYLAEVFGTVPHDAVGLLGGDWLKIRRMENFARIRELSKEILDERKVADPEPISLRVGKPLLEAASMESQSELQRLWARLIANAMDPTRDVRLRREFIETLSHFEPVDAVVLEFIDNWYRTADTRDREEKYFIPETTPVDGLDVDTTVVSVENLERLHCLVTLGNSSRRSVTSFGKLLLRACRR